MSERSAGARVAGIGASFAIVVAIGCGPTGSPGEIVAAGDSADAYLPRVVGAEWVYSLDVGGPVPTEVSWIGREVGPVRGLDGEAFIVDEVASNRPSDSEPISVAYLVRDGFLVRVSDVRREDGEPPRLGDRSIVSRMLPIAATGGESWTDEVRGPADDAADVEVERWAHTVERVARVTVPAGTFESALVVETEYWPAGADRPLYRFESTYVRGVGMVRHRAWNLLAGGEAAIEQVLAAYRRAKPACPPCLAGYRRAKPACPPYRARAR